jgi:hypothetical protein
MPMLLPAATVHPAAVVHAAPAEALRAQPRSKDDPADLRRALSPAAQARLDAVLRRFDVIDYGIAWKMRW